MKRILPNIFKKEEKKKTIDFSLSIKERKCMLDSHHNNPLYRLTKRDIELMDNIKTETDKNNLNNVTRTNAYLHFFDNNREVHWALLAHVVSRNGGWNMTDLKGEAISGLLSFREKELFFSFLEKSNFLIFHDAYQQLLLYEHSKKIGKPLFHLLNKFGISSFMRAVWEVFWKDKNSKMLTLSLIINEQHFIEKRIIQNPFYVEHVIKSIPFQLQEKLGFTNVLIPYYTGESIQLAGTTVSQFDNITKRIHIGKHLYSLLFYVEEVQRGTLKYVKEQDHTGSRADFFPSIFTRTIDNSKKIYSPPLHEAWKNSTHKLPDKDDWFQSFEKVFPYYSPIRIDSPYNITEKYLLSLLKLKSIDTITKALEIGK